MADESSKESPVREQTELGLSGALVLVLVVGVVLTVLAGLLNTIWVTDGGSSDGLGKTAQWFGWAGATAVSVSLLWAGLTGRGAGAGVRVALLLVGAYLLVGTGSSGAGLLASLFRF